MRRASRIAAIGALLLGAHLAHATAIVYSVRTPGTGVPDTTKPTTAWTGNQGFDVVRFYVKFSVGGVEATDPTVQGVGGIAGTLTSTAPFKLGFTKVTPGVDGQTPYANLDNIGTRYINEPYALTFSDPHTDNTNINTMIYVADWDYMHPTAIGATSTNMTVASQNVTPAKSPIQLAANLGGATTPISARRIDDSTADVDPRYLYQNPSLYTWNANGQPALGLTEFRVEGVVLKNPSTGTYTSTAPDTTAMPNSPLYNRGALVAVAVVPTGASVRFRGLQAESQGVSDDRDHKSFFDVTDGVIPEPGSISLLTLGAIGLLARRSRKQA